MAKRATHAKYLRKHPEIKPCVVVVERRSSIERLLGNNTTQRRSQRLLSQASNSNAFRSNELNRTPKRVNRPTTSKSVSKPKSRFSNSDSPTYSPLRQPIQLKSIIKPPSRMRYRSKSVSFDLRVHSHESDSQESNSSTRPNVASARRILFDRNSNPVRPSLVRTNSIAGTSRSDPFLLSSFDQNVPLDVTTYFHASPLPSNVANSSYGDELNEMASYAEVSTVDLPVQLASNELITQANDLSPVDMPRNVDNQSNGTNSAQIPTDNLSVQIVRNNFPIEMISWCNQIIYHCLLIKF